jgi:hypothetical protein
MIYFVQRYLRTSLPGHSRGIEMKRWIWISLFTAVTVIGFPVVSAAKGTRYFIDWPKGHIGPVFVQVYDIRCNPPFEKLDRFKVWVTWDKETKCYEIGNWGTYTLQFYKYDYHKCPMIISGTAASFKIRYSLVPPWI